MFIGRVYNIYNDWYVIKPNQTKFYLSNICLEDLALNSLQELIYHKIPPINNAEENVLEFFDKKKNQIHNLLLFFVFQKLENINFCLHQR